MNARHLFILLFLLPWAARAQNGGFILSPEAGVLLPKMSASEFAGLENFQNVAR